MKRSADWQPLSSLGEQSGLTWRLAEQFTEYTPVDDIVLDVDGLRRMAFFAGFDRHVTIGLPQQATQKAKESKPDTPHVSGINADGSATGMASFSRSPKQVLGDFDTQRADNLVDRINTMFNRAPLTVGVDVDGHTQALEKQRKVRNPDAWAQALDKTVRSQIRQASRQHLVNDQMPMLLASELLFGTGSLISHTELQADTLTTWAATHGWLVVTGIWGIVRHRNREQIHTSIMQPQVDRYLAAAALCSLPMTKIIKAA